MKSLSKDSQANKELILLESTEGSVEILPLKSGRFKVMLRPIAPERTYVPRGSCETSLPPSVVASFLQVSFARLCDSLARHDDPDYVGAVVCNQILAYLDPPALRGKRILDFGCGSGASTFWIATVFPETEVVGVELDPRSIRLAREVQAVRHLPNVQFHVSPDGNSLAPGIGMFDFVMLSAVYEHLLPHERRQVMPLLWSGLRDGGVLFVNGTPHRYFPYEHHSTGLWLVNYLPDRVTKFLARNFSSMHQDLNRSRDWNGHLRGGIRGGTEAQICADLRLAKRGRPIVVQPKHGDRAGYWLAATNPDRLRMLKRVIAALFRITDKLWGTVPSMNIDVAIQKEL
jgi:predicted O-methyltransferase YrrM